MPNDVHLPVHQAKEKGRNRVVVEANARQK
jgi:hypothetical protein